MFYGTLVATYISGKDVTITDEVVTPEVEYAQVGTLKMVCS